MKPLPLHFLFQICDSSFPTGGFVFSSGLESIAKHGFLKQLVDLRRYFYEYYKQLYTFDVPFIRRLYFSHGNFNAFASQINEYHAMLYIDNIRQASLIQGKNWLRLLPEINDMGLHIKNLFKKESWKTHMLGVMVSFLRELEYDIHSVIQSYVYLQIRDQVNASIRLGLVGPMESQSIISEVLSIHIPEPDMEFTPFKSSFLADICQARHSNIYSKLFQN